jgi:hypothetical protein
MAAYSGIRMAGPALLAILAIDLNGAVAFSFAPSLRSASGLGRKSAALSPVNRSPRTPAAASLKMGLCPALEPAALEGW